MHRLISGPIHKNNNARYGAGNFDCEVFVKKYDEGVHLVTKRNRVQWTTDKTGNDKNIEWVERCEADFILQPPRYTPRGKEDKYKGRLVSLLVKEDSSTQLQAEISPVGGVDAMIRAKGTYAINFPDAADFKKSLLNLVMRQYEDIVSILYVIELQNVAHDVYNLIQKNLGPIRDQFVENEGRKGPKPLYAGYDIWSKKFGRFAV